MTRYDYNRQAWTKDWRYRDCGHPETMDCECYGRKHAGERVDAETRQRMIREFVEDLTAVVSLGSISTTR